MLDLDPGAATARRARPRAEPGDRPLHRQHPLRREDRRHRPPGPRPELPRDGRDQRVGPALGPDRRHPPERADHRRRPGRDGGRDVARGRDPVEVGQVSAVRIMSCRVTLDPTSNSPGASRPMRILARHPRALPGHGAERPGGRLRPCTIACRQLVERLSRPRTRGAEGGREKPSSGSGRGSSRSCPRRPRSQGDEAKKRLEKVRAALVGDAETGRASAASKVTIQGKGLRLTEVLKQLQSQSATSSPTCARPTGPR